MADPRRRGFNRGKGKWHRPQPPQYDSLDPTKFGWQQTAKLNTYHLNGATLQPFDGAQGGWLITQTMMMLGEEREVTMHASDGELAILSSEMVKDLKKADPPIGATHQCAHTGRFYRKSQYETQVWDGEQWVYFGPYPPESTEVL